MIQTLKTEKEIKRMLVNKPCEKGETKKTIYKGKQTNYALPTRP